VGAFDDIPLPSALRPGQSGIRSWDDWDANKARNGYTQQMGALRGLSAPGANPIDLPAPTLGLVPTSEAPQLSPAALALSARAAAEDFLTVTYDVREPGFAELYDTVIQPQWSVPFGRLLLSVFLTLPRDTGWQGLDVACGSGYPTLELARYTGQDADIAGIDIWEDAILLARRKATDSWLRNVTFLIADVMRSGLPENAFDTITCNIGLTSFSDRAAALGAMLRLARPRGRLLLTTPTQSAMREFLDTYYLVLRDLGLGDYQKALERQIALRPTLESVRALLEKTGWQIERVVTDTFTLKFPTALAFLRSPLIQTTFMAAWRGLISDMTVRRLVFNEVQRRLEVRAAVNGGELAMTVPMACFVSLRA
jgi:ubiquinone/menaquinone biosynthesis C-methylase UbiE